MFWSRNIYNYPFHDVDKKLMGLNHYRLDDNDTAIIIFSITFTVFDNSRWFSYSHTAKQCTQMLFYFRIDVFETQ